jgi:hypothetical protein
LLALSDFGCQGQNQGDRSGRTVTLPSNVSRASGTSATPQMRGMIFDYIVNGMSELRVVSPDPDGTSKPLPDGAKGSARKPGKPARPSHVDLKKRFHSCPYLHRNGNIRTGSQHDR